MNAPDPRLILSDDGLDAALEAFLLAEAALWTAADGGLEGDPHGLGRGHWRAAVLMKRRPGLGVQALARLTGLSKQGASRILLDLVAAGYAERGTGEEDARRRPAVLTDAGRAFEGRASERARSHLGQAFRLSGLDAVTAARRVLLAVAAAPLGEARP